MTSAQHRARAEELRRQGTPKALEVAAGYEQLARMIEHRRRAELIQLLLEQPLKSAS
jgi:hypothetical protein